jgi:hypothetical protein
MVYDHTVEGDAPVTTSRQNGLGVTANQDGLRWNRHQTSRFFAREEGGA